MSVILFNRPQRFYVTLGTGSSDLLVASTLCTSCNSTISLFDPSRSSSITSVHANTTISYGSGTVAGTMTQDVVSMGSFTVRNQTFCMLTPAMSSVCQMLTPYVDQWPLTRSRVALLKVQHQESWVLRFLPLLPRARLHFGRR